MSSNSKPSKSPVSGYLHTLDGWRALAILSVIAFHDHVEHLGRLNDRWVHSQGALGVDLFFAISGLLICSRLLDEERVTGTISLLQFYVRRSFRIFPAMVVYLITVALLGGAHVIQVGRAAWWSSLLFLNNYYSAFRHDAGWSVYTNHFWSLAVEEHFYLLLPSLLVFFPRSRSRLLGILCAAFLLFSLGYSFYYRHAALIAYQFGCTGIRIDQLLIPALLAVLLRRDSFQKRCQRFCQPWFVLPFVAALFVATLHVSHTLTMRLVVPCSFPFLILATVMHPRSVAGRVLELWPLRAVGRISYSLYLWQQLFFIGDHQRAPGALGHLQYGVWKFAATLTAALASYFLVERPFIRLGHRLTRRATPGDKSDLALPQERPLGASAERAAG